MNRPFRIVLVLSGGNALGSYQAGVYQALHERGLEPDWIVGASIGAINGALMAGNDPATRLDQLSAFWRPADPSANPAWWPSTNETIRRTAAVTSTMALGRQGVFDAIGPLGSWWQADPAASTPALFDSRPLARSLARLVDFDRLNGGAPRYTTTAVDLSTGEDVVFDTTHGALTVDHVRASAALTPTFPAVAIGDGVFVDGGISANLPLDPVLREGGGPTLCIAVDLLPLAGAPPQTLGEAIGRAQDLIFAAQSRRTIARWRATYDHDPAFAKASMTLVRLAYADQDVEVAGKSMDFSPASVGHRWSTGHRDAEAMLDDLENGVIRTGVAGLTTYGCGAESDAQGSKKGG